MSLLWNGDLSTGDLSQYGGWEPPLSQRQRVTVGQSLDGFTAPLSNGYMMRLDCSPGDTLGTAPGWRTYVNQYSPSRSRDSGYDSSFVWAMLLPPTYYPDGESWMSPFEFHQSGSVTSAPCHVITYPSQMYVNVFGGDPSTPTSPTRYVDHSFLSGYTKGVWYVFVVRYLHNAAPNGIFQLWWGKQGTDLSMVQEVNATGIGTKYNGMTNRMLLGQYRKQSGTSTHQIYLANVREYSTSAEALAYATSILNSSIPIPPTYSYLSSIANNDTITDGEVWVISTDDPSAAKVEFYADNALISTQLIAGGKASYTLHLPATSVGGGFHVLDTNDAILYRSPTINWTVVASGFSVRIKSQTSSSVTIEWDPVADQVGFIPLLDGSPKLTDGKNHPNMSTTQSSVQIGKPNDGKQHDYGVAIMTKKGSVRA